jgi:hypothetical protein
MRWLDAEPRSRLQFIRRPGRASKRLLAFSVRSGETAPREVRRMELESHADLAAIDADTAGDVVESSLLLVCGHGTRDACCAARGAPVYAELAGRLGEEEVWISSHQGGHRFAANLLVLPVGLQFGRLGPGEAPLVAARALADRIELGYYRGRTCYDARVQAAERAVREVAGLEGVTEITLESVDDRAVTFRVWDGTRYEAVVEETNGPAVPASCGAEPEPQLHYIAASVTQLSGAADTRDR